MSRRQKKAVATPLPTRCVVDTNVATTANGANADAPESCVATCAAALRAVIEKGHLFLDADRLIVGEYSRNLNSRGQPGAGDFFLKWVLTHEWNEERVTRVSITAKPEDTEDFEELLPADPSVGQAGYDRSDRKFLAVAAAHPDKPPILQALDSKWWGWKSSLAKDGVTIHFLCEKEIAEKYQQKMGK